MGITSKSNSTTFCNDKNIHPKKFVITYDTPEGPQILLVSHETFDSDLNFRKNIIHIKCLCCNLESDYNAKEGEF